jgi:8-hydroxy-5-deazaflavin:NADPH oxidoreductase
MDTSSIKPLKIGIIGTGNMGRTLGVLWSEIGHEVFFGARDPQIAAEAVSLTHGKAKAGTNDQAALHGEVLVYSPRGVHPDQVLSDLSTLEGKIVIDLNNSNIPEGFQYAPGPKSLAEELQAQIPNARVVKAFNTIAQETFELCPTDIRPYNVAVPIASDDEAARQLITALVHQMGMEPIDCGPLSRALMLENLADFIRFLMMGAGRPDANFSFPSVPDAAVPRLGGRRPSRLY